MKQVIRPNTFETNSSSSHSLVFCSKEEYKDLKDGKLYLGMYDDSLYTREEFENIVSKIMKEDDLTEEEVIKNHFDYDLPMTYRDWQEFNWDRGLDTDVYEHTTKNGEEIVAIVSYGTAY